MCIDYLAGIALRRSVCLGDNQVMIRAVETIGCQRGDVPVSGANVCLTSGFDHCTDRELRQLRLVRHQLIICVTEPTHTNPKLLQDRIWSHL